MIRKAVFLSWFTIIYNLIEGAVSIGFGVAEESVALAGFGVDSLIEVASAFIILWRFRSESEAGTGTSVAGTGLSLERERGATLGIGILFLILAGITFSASVVQLLGRNHPETTLPGVVISSLSLSFMFWLWRSKKKVAIALNSAAMMNDAACSLACIKLSGVLLAGSLLFYLVPELWWVDSVVAILISGLIGKEGWDTVRAARSPEFTGGCCGGCEAKSPI